MNKLAWATRGVLRLVLVVGVSLLMAGLAYLAIIAIVLHFPPNALQR